LTLWAVGPTGWYPSARRVTYGAMVSKPFGPKGQVVKGLKDDTVAENWAKN